MTHPTTSNSVAVPPLVYNPPQKEDFPQSASFRTALVDILANVESSTSQSENNPIVLFKSDKYVCIYDKYPKAKYHVLLMCRQRRNHDGSILNKVQTLNDLTPLHLADLREFHELGRNISSRLMQLDKSTNNPANTSMMLGYHAIPSLLPLHLHIISSDFDSPCITTRKHIVSFHSQLFFVTPESLECHIESAFAESATHKSSSKESFLHVSIRNQRARDALSSTPMECMRCGRMARTVPDWKRHNQSCRYNNSPHIDDSEAVKRCGKLNSLLGWARKVVEEEMGNPVQRKRQRVDEEHISA